MINVFYSSIYMQLIKILCNISNNDTRMTENYAEFAIETTKHQISWFPTCHIILNMHVQSYLEISQDVLM